MSLVAEREAVIRQFLLGELADDRRTEVELSLLTDDEYFDEVILVEGDLIDELAFGGLSDEEKEKLHSHFLAPVERQEQLYIAKAIDQYVSERGVDRDWEEQVSEAGTLRRRISSLITNDWLGLKVAALLRAAPQTYSELCLQLSLDDVTINTSLEELKQVQLIQETDGLLCCSSDGLKVLADLEASTGVKLSP